MVQQLQAGNNEYPRSRNSQRPGQRPSLRLTFDLCRVTGLQLWLRS